MANENRLIDANALIKHMKDLPTRYEDGGGSWLCLDGYPKGMFDPEDVISSIENAPTVDAEPVVHGRWVAKETMIRSPFAENYYCSECQTEGSPQWKRCPVCEAKMDGERK